MNPVKNSKDLISVKLFNVFYDLEENFEGKP